MVRYHILMPALINHNYIESRQNRLRLAAES